jgi:hypothetical protein
MNEAAPPVAVFDGWASGISPDWLLITSETSVLWYRFRNAQAAPSLLRCGILALHHDKLGFARRLLRNMKSRDSRQGDLWNSALEEGHIWQRRFYDFVVFTEHKRAEKLCYMHQNPVKRGLVLEPQQWAWSSFRHYEYGEPGAVLVNEPQRAELQVREIA